MGTLAVDPSTLVATAVTNRQAPCENPKIVPMFLNFALAEVYTLNGLQLIQQNRFCQLQTIYIDASGTDQQTTVTIQGSNQVIRVKGRTQGWYPVAAPNPFTLSVENDDGAVNMLVLLSNLTIPPAVWATQ